MGIFIETNHIVYIKSHTAFHSYAFLHPLMPSSLKMEKSWFSKQSCTAHSIALILYAVHIIQPSKEVINLYTETEGLFSVEHSHLFSSFFKLYYMFLEINDHHQATNTKSQSEVKYNASIFIL